MILAIVKAVWAYIAWIQSRRTNNFTYPRLQSRTSPRVDEHTFSQPPLYPNDPSNLNETPEPYRDHGFQKDQNAFSLEPPPRLGGDLTPNGSSGESLIDLYRQHKSNGPVPASTAGRNAQSSNTDLDSSRWIHRDKLTQIEIKEYEERGMQVPPELLRRAAALQGQHREERPNGHKPRSESRTQRRSDQRSSDQRYSDQQHNDQQRIDQQHGEQQHPTQRYSDQQYSDPRSTTPEFDDGAPFVPEDPRTPEEIAADPYEDHLYASPGLKSSSSRIPLSTSSPLPVPIEHLERNTPLPRKRGASGQWDEENLYYSKQTRSRGNSGASQAILDEADGRSNLGSVPSSPEKIKPAARNGPAKKPGSRNVSAHTNKSRTTSATRGSPAGLRPGTRSGPDGRPSTSHKPEGDPPWLATMYKPDPRLPPDQQVIPTHAKRMMQEQWEREGRPGNAFDRAFTPVSVYTTSPQQKPQQMPTPSPSPPPQSQELHSPQPPPDTKAGEEPSRQGSNAEAGWPLRRPSAAEQRSPTVEHAGYSTMPKVQNTPPIGSLPSPKRLEAPVQNGMKDEKKKETGCGCCVVM